MNLPLASFSEKEEALKKAFSSCQKGEEIYSTIMEWGKKLSVFSPEWKKPENRVTGCQSLLYLHAREQEGRLYFAASSDALISAGLAALLIHLYSGETPETILKTSPTLFEEIGIIGSLTPSRANGLASLHLKMKQEALKLLMNLNRR